jgi:DNA helicase-4
MEWKRELHEKNKATLVETFHYEHSEGVLVKNLEVKLKTHAVSFDPIPEEAELETLCEFGAVTEFSRLLAQLL